MRRKDNLPELLAPAGDFESLVAAVRGGADAAYVGGKLFSARAYAKNFDLEEIKRAVSYCHLHGVKLYVTMNVLLYDNEFEEALDFARSLYVAGVDALIVADFGLVRLLRECLPNFELHASTQMGVHNSNGADEAYLLGCTRVVLARELSGKNIKAVTEKCKAQTEVFLHGALCVCHSGQCLFSSMIGGRSGNRGECAQPCRLPYNDGKYVLSLSDLSLAHHINELIDAGVASLKIEGRMKSPDYVYTVTSIYRKLLDERRCSSSREDLSLERAFSRSGFTDGYFVADTFRKMTGVRTEEDKAYSKNEEKGSFAPDRVAVKAHVRIKLGEPSEMTLSYKNGERAITVKGDSPDVARSYPLTIDAVKERLSKMGNTYLSLSVQDIELDLDEGVNLSPSSINALRRSAAEKFENFGRVLTEVTNTPKALKDTGRDELTAAKRTALFFNADALIKASDKVVVDYFDSIFVPLADFERCSNIADGVYLPPIVMENEVSKVKCMIDSAVKLGARYALVGNLSHISMVKESGLEFVGDFRLNVCNTYARLMLEEIGIKSVVLSPELTARQARAVGGNVIVYGRLPLMITERCFMKENFGCERCGKCSLIDRKGIKFPMMREFEHRNIIFNSVFTYMGDKMDDLYSRDICGYHYIFTTENEREISMVTSAFSIAAAFPLGGSFRRMGKRKVE